MGVAMALQGGGVSACWGGPSVVTLREPVSRRVDAGLAGGRKSAGAYGTAKTGGAGVSGEAAEGIWGADIQGDEVTCREAHCRVVNWQPTYIECF